MLPPSSVRPAFQLFCGEEFLRHDLTFDRSSMTRWHQRMGAKRLEAPMQESLAVTLKTEALRGADCAEIIVDTTVQDVHRRPRLICKRCA